MNNSIRNIGILAHVDAGKTTLTEHLLLLGEAIRQKGYVDKGSAVTDSMSIERERGISVRTATNTIFWKDHQINLIDTPGHQDFFGEVDRVFSVLDGAVLIISAVEGLQSTLFLLWEALKYYKIPVLAFINKTDRSGSNTSQVIEQIKKELNIPVFQMNFSINEGGQECSLKDFNESPDISEANLETLATIDESIMEPFLNGDTIAEKQLESSINKNTLNQQLMPVFCGSAKTEIGIEQLLNGLIRIMPEAKQLDNAELHAKVFKVEHDKTLGRVAYVRSFQGRLLVRGSIFNQRLKKEEKVAQIFRQSGKKNQDLNSLVAGDIAMVSGMSEVQPGDYLGHQKPTIPDRTFQEPVLQVRIEAEEKQDTQRLGEALTELSIEDPFLNFHWDKNEQEMHINLMGSIQQEIIGDILNERFNLTTIFNPPTIIYKETPLNKARGLVRYTMPKPCWAVLLFEIQPLPIGSGVRFESKVSVDKIHRKYQNEVRETIRKSLKQGIKGWKVDDISITLIEGEDHEMHSRPGDFILATPMGILRAIKEAGTSFLEPVYRFTLHFSDEYLGPISNEITKLRGSFAPPEFSDTEVRLSGLLPVATSQNFPIRLNNITAGRARLRLYFGGYRPCANEEGIIREYKGINPLDESLWILHKRGAYKI